MRQGNGRLQLERRDWGPTEILPANPDRMSRRRRRLSGRLMRLMRVRGRWRVVLTRAEETLATLSPANSELRFAKNSTEEPRSELGICLGFVVWAAPPN